MKGKSVPSALPCTRATPVPVQRPVHYARDPGAHPSHRPTSPQSPGNLGSHRLRGRSRRPPHHCVIAGDFKLLLSRIHRAISTCVAAVRSAKSRGRAPAKQEVPSWRPVAESTRCPLDQVTKANGAENAAAACLASFFTAFAAGGGEGKGAL